MTNDDVVDLTDDKPPSPKTSIFSVLSAKRQKRGTDTRNKASGIAVSNSSRKSRTDTANEVQHTKDNNMVDSGKITEAPDFEVLHSSDEYGFNARENRPPAGAENDASSVNDDTLQYSMETSDSQRPMLARFRRFSRRNANGFISARVTNKPAVSFFTKFRTAVVQ